MKIYGVAILAGCYLAGQLAGELLGRWTGVQGNIGGVGFAMLMLILLSDWMKGKGYMGTEPEKGILFWNAMYIPVVIAMSATQHVNLALHSGWLAVWAGIISTSCCFLLVPLISSMTNGRKIHNPEQGS